MLPDNILSTIQQPAAFLPPRNRFKDRLVDYELGGTDINDATAGLQVKTWRGQYIDSSIVIDAPGVEPITLLTAPDITKFQFTFDQNMQPFIAYVQSDVAKYRWFDGTVPGFVIDELPVGSITPRCALDDKRKTQGAVSDIILAYVRADVLYMRVQLDRYDTEYQLQPGLAGAVLEQVGMSVNQRFQFRLTGGPTVTPQPVPIERILAHICARSGVESFDASEHETNMVDGYALTRETTGRAAIEPLRMAGLFDIVESDGVLRFPLRGKLTVATIAESELGAIEEGEAPVPLVTTTKVQDFELPRQIRVRYPSLNNDYETAEQLSPSRIGTVGVNDVSVDIPVVLPDSRAVEVAEIMFREAWSSRWSHDFTLPNSRYDLDASDCVLLPIDGRNYRVRITTIADTGLAVRRATAVRDEEDTYISTAISTSPNRPAPVPGLIGDTEATLLDLPALKDEHDDAGAYIACRRFGARPEWNGAIVHRSIDDGATYTALLGVAAQAVIGTVVSAPAAGITTSWDDDEEYVIDVLSGSLQSRTDDAVLAGANAAAVGVHGRWHIFQFADQELVAADQYRLTRLLLGRRGTERHLGDVVPGDQFVLVSGPGIYRLPLQQSEIGVSRIYRAVTVGRAFATGADVVFAGAGEALKPFTPVYVRGARDGSENLTIAWLRRDRLSQTLRSGVTLPLSEASESYEVDVLDGPTVVRTIASGVDSAAYSAVDQVADFGAAQAALTVRIYQLSAVVGRGAFIEATI